MNRRDVWRVGTLFLGGVEVTATAAEINAISGGGLSAAELGVLDSAVQGSASASKAVVLDSNGDFDNDVGQIRQTAATLATPAGTGITGGTGTVYESSIQQIGGIFTTTILLDLTGLNSMNTDGDIIGVNDTANPCHLGRIVAADSGTILGGTVRCLEVPAGGDPNVFFGAADEGTGVENDAFSGLTNGVTIFDPAADWTVDMDRTITGVPGANQYLYAMQGDATGTDDTYTAGKFLITFYGY